MCQVPWSVGIVFDNVDDNLHAHKLLYNDLLDEHGLVNTIYKYESDEFLCFPVSRYNCEKEQLVLYVFSSCASCAALVNIRECT